MDEMQSMLINDNFKYPAKGIKEIKKAPYFQDIQPEYLEQAKQLVREESNSYNAMYPMFNFDKVWNNLDNGQAMFFPGTKEYDYSVNRTKAE